ncbi:MAG TPA: ASKHA domain-containing protein [Bryobacteraceae bacterium]|nr:ASKHA domain-containing protein [Bryobacteraceae bacterium]
MNAPVRITLEPLGKSFLVERGTALADILFPYGVEFPCGGHGRCRRCKVRVLEGRLAATPEEERLLPAGQIADGWRLACHGRAEDNLTLEIAQWQAAILADDSSFTFTPREGRGLAVDLGTTTLVAQLVDLTTGQVLGVRTALNPQVAHGSDVMSRVEFAGTADGLGKLRDLIREEIGALAADLAGAAPVRTVAIVGNTVMHHLFCGIDVEPLSHCPFEPVRDGLEVFGADELGWDLAGNPEVRFLPCLGGFVGSDILAGILATRMAESDDLVALMDLGTNGEIVVGNRQRLLCASTAAGPAFEGGRISCGMRAATGAIAEVDAMDGAMVCRVLGNVPPRGICGSGLVDAVAAALDLGWIQSSGRLAGGNGKLPVQPPVELTQRDIRELQLAKAATAAGLRIVLARWGAEPGDLRRLYLAGAFGNYLNRTSARRIGLIELPQEKIEAAGNTALLGAKLALFQESDYADLRGRIEHVPLGSDPVFQDQYVESMVF